MTKQYTSDDLFWDIESLDELFTAANYYPKSNSIVLSLLIDNPSLKDQLKKQETYLRQAIIKGLPEGNFKAENIHLEYLDELGHPNAHPDKTINKNNISSYGLLSFVKRFGYTEGQPDKSNYQEEMEHVEKYQPKIKKNEYDQGNIRNGRRHPQWFIDQQPNVYHPRDIFSKESTKYIQMLRSNETIRNEHYQNQSIKIDTEGEKLQNNNEKIEKDLTISEVIATKGHHAIKEILTETPQASGHYYPVKDTDKDEYNPEIHGRRFGYNSTNYDMTMLSAFINGITPIKSFLGYDISEVKHKGIKTYHKKSEDPSSEEFIPQIPSGQAMRKYNNELFSNNYINQMTSRLSKPSFHTTIDHNAFGDYSLNTWLLHKAWRTTNRFVDVSTLNEKMSRVGMKRLLGYLGRRIKEFEGLSSGKPIEDINTLIDLLVYNVADVINLKWIFEHPTYQETYKLRQTLLEQYPMTVYEPAWNEETNQYEAFIHEANIKKGRLTTNSTSARFVENIISPNSQIKDIETVSFMYPSEQEAKRLGIERFNVLDMCKDFFDSTFKDTKAQGKFDDIYNFYKAIEGQNFNDTKKYKKDYGENEKTRPRSFISDLMNDGKHVEVPKNSREYRIKKENAYEGEQYGNYNNTHQQGTCLLYYNKDGSPSRYYLKFSVGGTHGAEYNKNLYDRDIEEYKIKNNKITQIKEKYKSQIMATLNEINSILDDLPNDKRFNDGKGPLTKLNPNNEHDLATAAVNNNDLTYIELDGEEYKLRDFIKSGSTRKEAFWNLPTKPPLFKYTNNRLDLNDKYKWTSQLFAKDGDHSTNIFEDDFTSYYPLMLTRMSVYSKAQNKKTTQADTLEDIYLELFEQRKEYKTKAKDPNITDEERNRYDLIQNAIKLLLNSATGVSNAVFENNVRADNSILSMRIIGQLFAWYVGQKQLLQGGKVVSTNTDGLYIAGQPLEVNQQVLDETGQKIHVEIEPEEYSVFVSKDSNNRVKISKDGKISPKGGTLGAYNGPNVTSNLDHPAVIDRLLTKYLTDPKYPNSASEKFDKERAREILTNDMNSLLQENKPVKVMQMFQWIVSGSPGTHQFITKATYDPIENKEMNYDDIEVEPLPRYNRIFLTKPEQANKIQTLVNATHRKGKNTLDQETVLSSEWKKADWILHANGIINADAEEAKKSTNSNRKAYSNLVGETKDIAKFMKVRNMPKHQNISIINDDLYVYVKNHDTQSILNLFKSIDLDAYINITEKTFKNSWQNTI